MASTKYSSFNNRYVLYFFFFLAIVDISYFINTRDFKSLMVFVLIAALTSMFNKNMIVVLCLSLVTTHIIKFGSKSYQEGMKNDNKEGAKNKLEMSSGEDEDEVVDNDEMAEMAEMDEKTDKKTKKDTKKDTKKETKATKKNDDENWMEKMKQDLKMDTNANADDKEMDKEKLRKKISTEIKKITPMINTYLDAAKSDANADE